MEETGAHERFFLSMLVALAIIGEFEQFSELIEKYIPEEEDKNSELNSKLSEENSNFFQANLLRLRYLPVLVAQEPQPW